MAETQVPEAGRRRATTRLREWVRDQVDPQERSSVTRLSEEAVRWLMEDGDLLDRFVYEQVYNTVAEIVRAVLLESRRVRRFQERLRLSADEQRAALRRWMDRMEHCNHTYVRLGSMTRQEVVLAANEHRTRTRQGAVKWRWFATLAAGMADDETVEQAFSAEEVERAYESAQDSVTASLDTILAGVEETLARILEPDGPPPEAPESPEAPEAAPNGPNRNRR